MNELNELYELSELQTNSVMKNEWWGHHARRTNGWIHPNWSCLSLRLDMIGPDHHKDAPEEEMEVALHVWLYLEYTV